MRLVVALLTFSLWIVPASAHVGEHGGMTFSQLLSHVFETDHIVFALIAVAVGIVSYRAGRRAEARAIKVRARGNNA